MKVKVKLTEFDYICSLFYKTCKAYNTTELE